MDKSIHLCAVAFVRVVHSLADPPSSRELSGRRAGGVFQEELLTDITELRIGELTVQIDRLLCVGFGDCMDELPTPFEFDDDGIAIFTADAGELSRDYVLTACDVCPVDALTVLDANGDQLVP